MFWRKVLKEKVDSLQKKVNELEVTKSNLQQNSIDNQELCRINANLNNKIGKLEEQIRDQLEADLFFTSAKICFELANGKTKKEVNPLAEMQRRQREQLAAVAMPSHYAELQQAPSLGLGIFG